MVIITIVGHPVRMIIIFVELLLSHYESSSHNAGGHGPRRDFDALAQSMPGIFLLESMGYMGYVEIPTVVTKSQQ